MGCPEYISVCYAAATSKRCAFMAAAHASNMAVHAYGLRPRTGSRFPAELDQRNAVRTFFSEIDYGPLHASLALRV